MTQKLAASEEYIAELEGGKLKEYEERAIKAEEKCQNILNKYSKDKQALIADDDLYKQLRERVKALNAEVQELQSVRDNLIFELNKFKSLVNGNSGNY